MVPFGAKNIFWLSRQKGKSNMDSFWTISDFLGHQNDFWKFQKVSKFLTQNSVKNTGHFSRLSWSTEALFERFCNFPHPTNMWWGVENYETIKKVAQLAMKNE